eukprot:4311702-Amphidinium_carterae.1
MDIAGWQNTRTVEGFGSGASSEELEMWATLHDDNTIIFHDNDFEIFVDPAGSRYFYKESYCPTQLETLPCCTKA